MHVQLNCVIVDGDDANRQEMASFLTTFGISVMHQMSNAAGLEPLLNRDWTSC